MRFVIDFSVDEDKKLLYSELKRLNSEYTVSIVKGKTSVPQIRYYRGVVLKMIADYMGEDYDAVHEFLLQQFSVKLIHFNGKELYKVVRTNEMSKVEFSEYIERIRRWASATLELDIPDPDSVQSLEKSINA